MALFRRRRMHVVKVPKWHKLTRLISRDGPSLPYGVGGHWRSPPVWPQGTPTAMHRGSQQLLLFQQWFFFSFSFFQYITLFYIHINIQRWNWCALVTHYVPKTLRHVPTNSIKPLYFSPLSSLIYVISINHYSSTPFS